MIEEERKVEPKKEEVIEKTRLDWLKLFLETKQASNIRFIAYWAKMTKIDEDSLLFIKELFDNGRKD